jgi:tetratricopeptide (TPR) repeat protein
MTLQRFAGHVLIALLLFSIPACSNPEQKKTKHFKRALEYIKLDDQKSAVLELKNAIQIDAKYADARYRLGLLLLKTGDPKGAFKELQRAVSLDPGNLDAGVKVAEFYLLSRNRKESRKYVEQVLSKNPDYLDALALLANLDLIEGDFDKALTNIDRAISLNQKSDKYYTIKGRILAAQQKWQESEELFKKAIELAPENFINYKSLLNLYEQKKDKAAFQKQLDLMIEKFPGNMQLYVILAGFHQKRNEFDKARDALLKALEIQPDSIQLHLLLAKFYKKQGQKEETARILNQTVENFPENIQAKVALAEFMFDTRQFDKARELMEAILATNPANGGANLIKARFFINEGKNREALELLSPLMSDYPKWGEPYYYSALAHLRSNEIELAQKSADVALQNDIRNDRYHALAAQIFLMRGDSNGAKKESTIALRINPKNFVAVKILVKALVQAKEFEQAIDLIKGIEKQIAGDPELISNLSIAYLGMNDRTKAQKSLERLLKIVPDSSRTLALLAALSTDNNIDKSIDFVKQHMKTNKSASHYLLLGELYFKNKRPDKALEAFNEAKRLQPENPQPYLMLSRLFFMLKQPANAIKEYNSLLEKHPDSIAAKMGLASIYERQKKYTEAKKLYIDVLKIKNDMPTAANNLAWLLASEENGDLGEALRLAMQAKQAYPKQPQIADTLGWVHFKRKSYSLAISQFSQALENRPDDPVILYHLALAQQGNGDREKALATIRKALASKAAFNERGEAETLLRELENGG